MPADVGNRILQSKLTVRSYPDVVPVVVRHAVRVGGQGVDHLGRERDGGPELIAAGRNGVASVVAVQLSSGRAKGTVTDPPAGAGLNI